MNELEFNQISDPITGEQIHVKDVDSLAEAYDRIRAYQKELGQAEKLIRAALGAMATGDDRTQRVNGDRHRVMMELPRKVWSNVVLKELWEKHSKLAPRYLRIAKIEPQLREVAKLRREKGPLEFMVFKEKLLSAEEKSDAPPRIHIETATDRELQAQAEDLREALEDSIEARRH